MRTIHPHQTISDDFPVIFDWRELSNPIYARAFLIQCAIEGTYSYEFDVQAISNEHAVDIAAFLIEDMCRDFKLNPEILN